jgi:hypothetical protein
LDILKPMTYVELAKIRPGYPLGERRELEDVYRKMIIQKPEVSFLYATVVGCHLFGAPDTYPGFTYYFQLTDHQIEQCIFDIADRSIWMKATSGRAGLRESMHLWDINVESFMRYDDPDIGVIYPRIEVVIPFNIRPVSFFPQEEDRTPNGV